MLPKGAAGKKKYKLYRAVNKTLWFTQCPGSAALWGPPHSGTSEGHSVTECVITMIRASSWCSPLKHALQSPGGMYDLRWINEHNICYFFSLHCPVASCWQVCNLGWCNEATTGKHYTSCLVFSPCSVNRCKCTSKTVLWGNRWLNLTKITRNSRRLKPEYVLHIPCLLEKQLFGVIFVAYGLKVPCWTWTVTWQFIVFLACPSLLCISYKSIKCPKNTWKELWKWQFFVGKKV